MFATFAGLVVFAIPVGAGVGQESPSSIQAAPCGLGIAAEGLGCAGVPGLQKLSLSFLGEGAPVSLLFPWPLSPWCWD